MTDSGNAKRAALTEGRVGATLIRLSIPLVFAFVSMLLFNLVDTIFVGMLGTDELAAISFSFPAVFFFNSISIGIGTGVTSLVSRTVGACKTSRLGALTISTLLLGLLIGIAVTVTGIATMEPLFNALGASGSILEMIKGYMTWWYLGAVFISVPILGGSVLRGLGDMKRPMYILIAAVVLNVVLDPILIFGFGPIPSLGMEGAAIATVIARFVTLPLTLIVLRKEEGLLVEWMVPIRNILKSWWDILKVGIPATFVNILAPVNTAIITTILAGYGKEVVAGFGAGTRLEALLLMPPIALSVALIPFIGQNSGASRWDRVRMAIKFSNRLSAAWGILIYLLLSSTSLLTVRLFTSNPEVIDAYWRFFVFSGMGYTLISVSFTAGSAFNAVGRPMPSAVLNIIRLIAFMVPFMLVGRHLLGLEGIFLGIALSNILAGMAGIVWLKAYFRPDALEKNKKGAQVVCDT